MPSFRYRAVSRSGQIVVGERQADSEAELAEWLKSRDLLPLRTDKGDQAKRLSLRRADGGQLTGARRAILIGELAVLLKSGLKLDRALALLHRSATRPGEAALLGRVLAKVQGGASFTEALRAEGRNFPPDIIAMVRAGETSGSLGDILERQAKALDRSRRMVERLQSSMIYPAILTMTAIISVVILVTIVIPAFEPLFAESGRQLPAATQALVAVASWLKIGGPILAAAALALGVAVSRMDKDHPVRHRLDRLMLVLPVAGSLLTHLDAARFCRTFGTLINAGVQMVPSLTLARGAVVNSQFANAIERIASAVQQGGRINAVLRGEPLWPPLMAELCQVGEETGRLADMLLNLAEVFEEEATRRCERLTALATPIITLLLGMLVAGVLAGLLSTILSVNELAM